MLKKIQKFLSDLPHRLEGEIVVTIQYRGITFSDWATDVTLGEGYLAVSHNDKIHYFDLELIGDMLISGR